MRTRLLLPLVLALAFLAACGSLPNRHMSRITPPAPRTALSHVVGQTNVSACGVDSASSKPLATGSHVGTISSAYRDVLREFIRPLDSASLLDAAWKGATDEAAKEGDANPGVDAPQLSDSSADADWDVFSSAYNALSYATDGQVDQVKMAFSAVSAMAKSVDEGHTYFLDPEEYAQEGKEQTLPGAIGVVLNGKQAPFVVEEVVPGAPADRSGLHAGDTIDSVDGCDVSSWDSVRLSSRVRGTAGTSVQLTLSRPASGPFAVDITREPVTFPDIDSRMLPQGIGYLQLHQFPDPRAPLAGGKPLGPALRDVLASFQSQGARGWILDLRGNPGGEVNSLQIVAGMILPPGTIFSFSDRAGHKVSERTSGNRIADPPLIAVLVDDQTASAAEILSSAVQDEQVVPVVGSTTAGIANGAELLGIGDGAGLSITHWQTYTLHDLPLNGTGVTPNIVVQRSAEDLAAGVDPPLEQAVALATTAPQAGQPATGGGQ